MIGLQITEQNSIIHATPLGRISESDIKDTVGPQVDKMLRRYAHIKGVLIDASDFEGWEDFSAFIAHMAFIRDHHDKIGKVAIMNCHKYRDVLQYVTALVPDTKFHFYDKQQEEEAEQWLRN